jgi:hypothetical protein
MLHLILSQSWAQDPVSWRRDLRTLDLICGARETGRQELRRDTISVVGEAG